MSARNSWRELVGGLLAAVLVLTGCSNGAISPTSGALTTASAEPTSSTAAPTTTRPSAPSTAVPAGPRPGPATSTPAPQVAEPTQVSIPAIGVQAKVVPVGLGADGQMQTPNFGLAAWYTEGPRPGAPGPAVVVAHVDSYEGPDVFFRLKELTAGDKITITRSDGTAGTWVVDSSEQNAKDALPTARIWNRTSEPVLRLITCGGAFDRNIRSYTDNVVVYASPRQ